MTSNKKFNVIMEVNNKKYSNHFKFRKALKANPSQNIIL